MIKKGYPPVPITYPDFVSRFNSCIFRPITDTDELNDLYGDYKRSCYAFKIEYILKHGYESVEDFAKWMCQDWNLSEIGNCLK